MYFGSCRNWLSCHHWRKAGQELGLLAPSHKACMQQSSINAYCLMNEAWFYYGRNREEEGLLRTCLAVQWWRLRPTAGAQVWSRGELRRHELQSMTKTEKEEPTRTLNPGVLMPSPLFLHTQPAAWASALACPHNATICWEGETLSVRVGQPATV